MTSSVQLFREKCIEPLQVTGKELSEVPGSFQCVCGFLCTGSRLRSGEQDYTGLLTEEAVKELKKCLEQKE